MSKSKAENIFNLFTKGLNTYLKVSRELRASRNEKRAEKRENRAEQRFQYYFGRKVPVPNSTDEKGNHDG